MERWDFGKDVALSDRSLKRMTAWVALAALAWVGVASRTAVAQLDRLPAEIVGSTNALTPAQVTTVTVYVEAHSKNLGDAAKPQAIRADRLELLQPLPEAGTPFRIKYGELLGPKLLALVNDPGQTELVVINALVIAGDLGTQQALDVLNLGAKSAKPAVRYQAAYGLLRTFETAAPNKTPAMRDDQFERAIAGTTERITNEKDPLVLDALVRALLTAANNERFRDRAVSVLSKSIGETVKSLAGNPGHKTLTEPQLDTLIRTTAGVRDILTAANQRPVPAQVAKDAAELAGRLIAHMVKAVEGKQIAMLPPDPIRDRYSQLATAAETVVVFSGTTLQPGGNFPNKDLGRTLKQATVQDDAKFALDGRTIAGSDGMLSKSPFNFPPDHFIPR